MLLADKVLKLLGKEKAKEKYKVGLVTLLRNSDFTGLFKCWLLAFWQLLQVGCCLHLLKCRNWCECFLIIIVVIITKLVFYFCCFPLGPGRTFWNLCREEKPISNQSGYFPLIIKFIMTFRRPKVDVLPYLRLFWTSNIMEAACVSTAVVKRSFVYHVEVCVLR